MKRSFTAKIISLLFLFSITYTNFILPTPINNPYDPVAFHTVFGSNKFYKKQDSKLQTSLNVSPFYQSAAGSRNKDGDKVPEGDIFGRWNMFGLFFGIEYNQPNAAPASKPFVLMQAPAGDQPYIPNVATRSYYPDLSDAWRVLDAKNEGSGIAYYDVVLSADGSAGPQYYYTNSDEYDLSSWSHRMPLIYTHYEKLGVRTQLNFDFDFGLGINVKSGVVDYKQIPEIVYDAVFDTSTSEDNNYVYEYLIKKEMLNTISSEVGLDLSKYNITTLEDTHVQVYWQMPFKAKDDNNDHVVTIVPYISAGVWLPTGKEKNQDIAFSLPTGNDGFWGWTLEGSMNFDFPGMVQIGFGAGGCFFESRDLTDYRIASHKYQQGIFPWKTKISKKPGPVWYFNASFMTQEFIENFSFYFDYIYSRHNKDEITVIDDDATRAALFVPTVNEQDSKWQTSVIHCGFDYKITPGLQLGVSFQAHLSGKRVYRNSTILGTMTFQF